MPSLGEGFRLRRGTNGEYVGWRTSRKRHAHWWERVFIFLIVFFSFLSYPNAFAHNFRRLVARVRHRDAPFGRPGFTEGHVSPKSSRGGLVLGERSEAQVRLDNGHLGEELLRLLALDGGVDDNIVTCRAVRLWFSNAKVPISWNTHQGPS